MLLVLTITLLSQGADARPTSEQALIEFELTQAQRAVDEKYGQKKPSELTPEETLAKIRDQAHAEAQVLKAHQLTAKEWVKASLSKSRAEYAAQKNAVTALEEKAKAQAEAAKSSPLIEAPPAIPVQRGISDATPVILEEIHHEGELPEVEKSLPPEVFADQAEALAIDRALKQEPGPKKPAAKASKKSKKKRD